MKKDPTLSREEHLAEEIKKMILQQKLEAGDQLPSVRELAEAYHVGKSTVTGALELLNFEGVIHTKIRYGSFVTSAIWKKYTKQEDWSEINRRSPYMPTNREYREILTVFKHTNSISIPTVGDGIYRDILHHATDRMNKVISESHIMEEYQGAGMPDLRVQLARHMASNGIDTDPRQIILAPTLHDVYGLIANLMVWSGSVIYYESPGPMNYYPYFKKEWILKTMR